MIDGVDYETREVQASVKPRVTVYQTEMVEAVIEGREPRTEGDVRVVEYACGDQLVQSDRRPVPPHCSECGAPMFEEDDNDAS